MANINCGKCSATVGDRNDSGELLIHVKKINMHYPVKIQTNGNAQLKCRQCNTVIDILENGVQTNEKASARDLLDNFGKKAEVAKGMR